MRRLFDCQSLVLALFRLHQRRNRTTEKYSFPWEKTTSFTIYYWKLREKLVRRSSKLSFPLKETHFQLSQTRKDYWQWDREAPLLLFWPRHKFCCYHYHHVKNTLIFRCYDTGESKRELLQMVYLQLILFSSIFESSEYIPRRSSSCF